MGTTTRRFPPAPEKFRDYLRAVAFARLFDKTRSFAPAESVLTRLLALEIPRLTTDLLDAFQAMFVARRFRHVDPHGSVRPTEAAIVGLARLKRSVGRHVKEPTLKGEANRYLDSVAASLERRDPLRSESLYRSRASDVESELVEEFEQRIFRALSDIAAHAPSDAHASAVARFFSDVDLGDPLITRDLARLLGKAEAGKLKPRTVSELRANFRGDIGNVKGELAELWFHHSLFAEEFRQAVFSHAEEMARKRSRPGRQWVAEAYSGRLLDAKQQPFLDGIVYIRQVNGDPTAALECEVIFTTEVKAGDRLKSKLKSQLYSDRAREAGGIVVTDDAGRRLLLAPHGDAVEPIRIVVMPEAFGKLQADDLLLNAIDPIYFPSLSDDDFQYVTEFLMFATLFKP